MFVVLLSILAIIVAVFAAPQIIQSGNRHFPLSLTFVRSVLIGGAVFGLLSRSFVIVDGSEIGLMKRIYLGDDLAEGRIIAVEGQKGPQAKILGPGFHFIPFVKVLFDIEYSPVIDIPENQYGLIIAKDGKPLERGEFIAKPWAKTKEKEMLNAEYFLNNNGQKGPQFNVLTPGQYRINPYLFDVQLHRATDVSTGHVAVVRSNIKTTDKECPDASLASSKGGEEVALTVVPEGCIGVWERALPPGKYYLNNRAYVVTPIKTRIQTWTYKGGYTERKIDLTVNDDGKIVQKSSERDIPVPKDAAANAINVRVEGWTIPVEMRMLVAVDPANAAKVVASVGGLQQIEDKIITPAARDILRSIGGREGRKVLDFINKRDEIVNEIEAAIIPEGLKAGVSIQEVRLGEPAIPPELLVSTLREQLASQLTETYVKEEEAQRQRIQVEKQRATADQQSVLVEAQIAKEAARETKEQKRLLGEGEKLKLQEIAKGRKALAQVLGKDAALQLAALEKALEAAVQNSDIVKVPTVNVSGAGQGSFEGAAAILGSSNIIQAIGGIKQSVK